MTAVMVAAAARRWPVHVDGIGPARLFAWPRTTGPARVLTDTGCIAVAPGRVQLLCGYCHEPIHPVRERLCESCRVELIAAAREGAQT